MKTTKKVLAIVLSVMLLLSVMPFAAFAADVNLSDILASATSKYVEIEDKDIVVDADTTLTGHILDLYGNVTIDLQGHNLVAGAANSSGQEVAIWINPGANVTITDSAQPSTAASYSSSTGVLTVKAGVAAISSTYYGIINEGNLTLGKAVVKGDDNAICLTAGSTLTTTEANSIICGGTYGVTYPGGTATMNLNKGMIYGQYGLSGNSSWDSANNCYKFGGNTINIGTAKIYGKGIDDENNGIVNGAAIVLGADDDCNITGNATITGFDAPAIVTRASADLDITASPTVTTNGTLTNVKVLDGATSVPCAPVVVDTACGYTKGNDIDVDIANGTYKANVEGVSNAIALVGESGETTADYVAVENGTYTTTTGADESVPFDDTTYVQDDFGKLFLASEIGTVYNAEYTNKAGQKTYVTIPTNNLPSSDGTYKLLSNLSTTLYWAYNNWANDITIDLNGFNMTSTNSEYVFTMPRKGTAAKHRVLNLINTSETESTIYGPNADSGLYIKNAYNDFTLGENINFVTKGATAWIGGSETGATNCTMTINGNVESTEEYALYVHGTNAGPNTVTVNGTVKGADAGIYAAGVADYEINGTVTGETGIYVAQGTVNVNDGATVIGTGANNDYEFNGSGMNSTGDGIAVDSKYATVPAVNVAEGATVESMAGKGVDEYKKSESTPAPVVDVDDDATIIEHNYVAKVGDNYFDSLEAAIASISTVTSAAHSKSVDGDKVTPYYTYVANGEVELLNDANGNGLMFGEGTDLTIDFNGHTYEIDGRTVGSNGTERCGFNFAKNSDITLKNGTLTSDKAKILVQNYADLTVENMTLTNANEDAGTFYTLSNNFGDVVITDSVINASENGTSYAYDISTGWAAAYADGVTVTMNGTTTINGNIEVGSYANYPGTATVALYLTSGTINGEIVASAYDTSWAKVSDDIGDNIVVTKSDECSYAAPEDYKWVSNGDGTSSLEKIEAKNGANLTLEGTIEEAIYLDANSYDLENDAVVKVTANASSNISEEPNVVTTTYNVKDLTPFVDPKGTYTGTYKFAIKNAPAQITEEIKVELFASASDTTPIKTITYSVKEYCDSVIKTSNNANLVALCKAILDYGRAAQIEFNYNTDNMAVDNFYNADAIEALTYSDITGTYLDTSLDIRGCTFQCLANTNINLYLYNSLTSSEMDASIDGDDESAIKADYMTSEQNGLFISVNNIEAGNLNKNFTVITSDGYVTTNARTVIKTCLYYGTAETLVKTIYFYANAADAYFN